MIKKILITSLKVCKTLMLKFFTLVVEVMLLSPLILLCWFLVRSKDMINDLKKILCETKATAQYIISTYDRYLLRRIVAVLMLFLINTYSLTLFGATFEVVDKLSVINSTTLGDNANDFTVIRGSVTLQDSGEGVTESRLIFGQTNPPTLYRPMSGAAARTLYLDNNLIIGQSGGIRVSTITFTPALTADPSTNITGMLYYNSSTNKLKIYDGSSWKNIAFGGQVSGTQNYIAKFTGAETLGNSTIFDNGTYVGINTSSPDRRLDVNGGVVVRSSFVVTGTGLAIGSVPAVQIMGSTMVVTTDGKVGIGTMSPGTYKLNVAGDIKATGTIDADIQFLGQAADTATAPSFSWTGDTDVGIFRPTTDVIGFGTAGTEKMRITSTGNVGIGTTSPGAKLQVGQLSDTADNIIRVVTHENYNSGFEAYGSGQGTGYVYVGQAGDYGGGMFYNGDGTPAFATGELVDRISFYRRSANNNEVVFYYPHNSNDVTFRGGVSAVNLGLGSVTPTAYRGINATYNYTGNYDRYGIYMNLSIADEQLQANSAYLGIYSIVSSSEVTIGSYKQYITGLYGDARYVANASAEEIRGVVAIARNYGVGSVNRLYGTLVNAQNYIAGGSVTDAFGVYSNVFNMDTSNTMNNAYAGYFKVGTAGTVTKGYGVFIDQIGGTDNYGLYQSYSGNKNYFAGPVGIKTSNPTGLFQIGGGTFTVLSEGNIGIGLTAPTKTLQIGNTSNSSSIYNDYIGYVNNMVFESRDSNDGGEFIFRSNQDTGVLDVVKINRFGAVGIGTTSPSAVLHISSASATATQDFVKVSTGTAAGSDVFAIKGNGNVGIGTTTPVTRLHVYGGGGYGLAVGTTAAGGVQVWPDANTGPAIIYPSGSALRFGTQTDWGATGWSEKMRITSSGAVGIGATSPAGLFQVGGGTLTVLSNGNVGISTTGPSAKLHIYGSDTSTYNGAQLRIDNTNGKSLYLGTRGGDAALVQSVGSVPLFINPDGNEVFIGTSSTSGRLTINNNTTNSVDMLYLNAKCDAVGEYVGLYFTPTADDASTPGAARIAAVAESIIGTNYPDAIGLAFYTHSGGPTSLTERMRIDSSGNVGIGTTSPSYRLDVSGGAIRGGGGIIASGGLIIETRTSDPSSPENGRIWLRTDL